MNPSEIAMIARNIGLGALVLDLHLTDYSRGSTLVEEGARCFWLTDGRQVRISISNDGSVIASTTREPDLGRPDPLEAKDV